jgi:hypothetical protein
MGTLLVAPYLASKPEKIERGDYAAEFPLLGAKNQSARGVGLTSSANS